MSRKRSIISLLTLLVLTIGAVSALQDPRATLPESIKQGPGMDRIPVKTPEQIDREQAQKRFEMRQAEIRKDTEKLFVLSGELKQYMDSTNSNVLSVEMIKKVETIEKLAHSVKQKMKESR